jgi:hypothetical protein
LLKISLHHVGVGVAVLWMAWAAIGGGDPLAALGFAAAGMAWCGLYCLLLVRGSSDVPWRSGLGEFPIAARLTFGVFPVALIAALHGPGMVDETLDLVLGSVVLPDPIGFALVVGIPVSCLIAWAVWLVRVGYLARALPPGRARLSRGALFGFVVFYAVTVTIPFVIGMMAVMVVP